MTTIISKQKKRGRPPGRSKKGRQSKEALYNTAIRLFAEQGYEQTTLRQIAQETGVSPGLLYKYYPSKVAVVLELYDRLSQNLETLTKDMPKGVWRERAFFTLRASLACLRTHRSTMKAVMPVMMADPTYGLFSDTTAFSRRRVLGQFERAVTGAKDCPEHTTAKALSHLLYVLHLGVIQWWLLDKSPGQRATNGLVSLLESLGRPMAFLFRLPGTTGWVVKADALLRDGLYDAVDSS